MFESSFDRVVVIGASAGGVEALRALVAGFTKDLPAPVFVVLHVPPYVSSNLPQILSESGPLVAKHPDDGERIKPGIIYVARPDHHLLIEDNHIAIKKGPKENRFRPSIDALFRSAAYIFRDKAIGVVLSGALDDGTSGLWTIKRFGGISLVQEPTQSQFESMPQSALDNVQIDYRLPAGAIGQELNRLARESVNIVKEVSDAENKLAAAEGHIAAEGQAFQKGIMGMGTLTPFTCPECHGVLVQFVEGKLTRYRCHTGHAYTDNALLEAVMEAAGELLWQVIRTFEEGAMLLKHMSEHLEKAGDHRRSSVFLQKAHELEKRSKTFHSSVLHHESLSGDNLAQTGKLDKAK